MALLHYVDGLFNEVLHLIGFLDEEFTGVSVYRSVHEAPKQVFFSKVDVG